MLLYNEDILDIMDQKWMSDKLKCPRVFQIEGIRDSGCNALYSYDLEHSEVMYTLQDELWQGC